MRLRFVYPACVILVFSVGCATVQKPPVPQEAPYTQSEQRAAQKAVSVSAPKALKHKIGIGRFTNETRYGKALLGGDVDPLGRQTGDMLIRRLTESGKFLVIELLDMGLVEIEQARAGNAGKDPRRGCAHHWIADRVRPQRHRQAGIFQ